MKLRLPIVLAAALLSVQGITLAQYPELPESGASGETTYQSTATKTVTSSETVAALYMSALKDESLTLTIGSGATLAITGELNYKGAGNTSITGTFTAGSVVKEGEGTLTIDGKSLVAKTSFHIKEGSFTIQGQDLDSTNQHVLQSDFTIEKGATFNLLSGSGGTPKDTSGTVTLNGGSIVFGVYQETYFGGKVINFNDISSISGGSDQSAHAGWRLEGGTGLTTPTTFNVYAAASGSRIDVKKITITRNSRGFVVFNVEKGSHTATGDLMVSSAMLAHTGSNNEGLDKKGDGSIVYTGKNTENGKLLKLKVSGGSFIIGNGGADGEWLGAIELAEGTTLGMNVNAGRDMTNAITSSGNSTLIQMGSGTTTLSGNNSGLKGSIIVEQGGLVAGTANAFGSTNMTVKNGTVDFGGFAYAGQISLTQGNLLKAGSVTGNVSINQTGVTGNIADMNLGGLNASLIKELTVVASSSGNAATRISGLTGNLNLNSVTLGIDSGMISADQSSSGTAAITFDGGSGSLTTNEIILSLSGDAATALGNTIDSGVDYFYIRLANATVNLNSADNVKFLSPYHIFESLLLADGTSGSEGWLKFWNEGTSARLTVGSGETYQVDGYDMPGISLYKGFTIMGTLKVNLDGPPGAAYPDGLTLVDLEGPDAQAAIDSTGSAAGSLITLTDNGRYMEGLYQGSIIGNADLVKSGADAYVLTINGTVQTPNLTVARGGLILGGRLEASGNTTVASGASLTLHAPDSSIGGTLDLEGNLTLGESAQLSVGRLIGSGTVDLNRSVLALNGDTMLTVAVNGQGTLKMQSGQLELSPGQGLGSGIDLVLDTPSSFVLNKDVTIGSLSGGGTVHVGSTTLTVAGERDGAFNGSFVRYEGGAGTLLHTGSGTMSLQSAGADFVDLKQAGSGKTVLEHDARMEYGDIDVSGGTLAIANDLKVRSLSVGPGSELASVARTDGSGKANTIEVAGDLVLKEGGYATLAVDRDHIAGRTGLVKVNGTVTQPASGRFAMALEGAGNVLSWLDPEYTIKVLDTNTALQGDLFDVSVADGMLKNLGFAVVGSPDVSDGMAVTIATNNANYLLNNANGSNASSAADALWNNKGQIGAGGTLDQVINALVAGGLSSAEVSDSLSAFAGSSTTALLASTRDDLLQQVKWIRNRTVQMGLAQDSVRSHSRQLQYNLWLQGNGGWNKVSQSGDKAGYTLDTWGGTVGMDMDLTDNFVVGAAFTYNNNKLKTKSFDYATGDSDAYYANLFARLQAGNWAHTLILTGGWNSMDLKRSVSIAGMAPLSTSGDTNGSSYGAFYEATYDVILNERNTLMIQPLANASIYRTTIDSYTESGAGDASMHVSGMDATYGTLGIGGRLMGMLSENIFGRSSLGEVRLQFVQDYGDRTDTARLCPVGLPGAGMKVHGTKVGTSGIQIGTGLAVPVGKQTTIFANLDADFRSKATTFGGNLGLRYSF